MVPLEILLINDSIWTVPSHSSTNVTNSLYKDENLYPDGDSKNLDDETDITLKIEIDLFNYDGVKDLTMDNNNSVADLTMDNNDSAQDGMMITDDYKGLINGSTGLSHDETNHLSHNHDPLCTLNGQSAKR